jgi:dihydrofolate reductase
LEGLAAHVQISEKLVDEMMIKLNPVLFGSGIPLISKIPGWLRLELKSSKTYRNGVVLLHYILNYQ